MLVICGEAATNMNILSCPPYFMPPCADLVNSVATRRPQRDNADDLKGAENRRTSVVLLSFFHSVTLKVRA